MASERPNIMEQRLNSRQALDLPMACEKCGSTYFEEIKLYQYSALSYGSNDYKLLTNQAKNLLKCPCGSIVVPQGRYVAGSTAARSAHEAFSVSTQAAKNFLDKMNPKAFAEAAASPSELKRLEENVSDLNEIFKKDSKELQAMIESQQKEIESLKASIPAPKKEPSGRKAKED